MLLSAFWVLVITYTKALEHKRAYDIRSKVRSGYRSIFTTGFGVTKGKLSRVSVLEPPCHQLSNMPIAIVLFSLSILAVLFIVIVIRNWSGFWYQSNDNNSNLLKRYIVLFFEQQLINKIWQFGSHF